MLSMSIFYINTVFGSESGTILSKHPRYMERRRPLSNPRRSSGWHILHFLWAGTDVRILGTDWSSSITLIPCIWMVHSLTRPFVCFLPVGQHLYLCVLVSLHLAVGLSMPPEPLLQILLCSHLLVFQLLLQFMNPGMMNTSCRDHLAQYGH